MSRNDKIHDQEDLHYLSWQHDLHPVWLRRVDIIQQKLRYIHRNPVEKGLVEEPHHYLYSSARNEAGLPGMLKLETIWGGDHRSPRRSPG